MAEPVRQAAGEVADHAERAAFAPGAAAGGRQPTATMPESGEMDAVSTQSWNLAIEVERYLRRQAPWWRRLGWWIWPG